MSKIVASAAIRGAHSWAEEAEAALKKAIEEKGESQKLEFPETAFFLPMAYSLLGMEAKTLGDANKIMTRVRCCRRSQARKCGCPISGQHSMPASPPCFRPK
jgi:acetyl-CoA synthase